MEFNFTKITLSLLEETDFLASRNNFVFPFSDTPAIFPYNRNLFVNKPCILVGENQFSG